MNVHWVLPCVTGVANAGVWVLAAMAWPDLPPRIPIHFDLAGYADGWTETGVLAWFALPALGTVLAAVFGWFLPRWMVRLARANSPWLNVPHKAKFMALPVEARDRAVRAPMAWLHAIAGCVQGLLGWLVCGSARVADGRWDVLPSWPGFAVLAVLLGCAVALAVSASRAVRREASNLAQ
ncbi:MAG: DUF1648 domain-containing protein [Planctomycetes bacterium]|nr:DUF1648 domain-containing protein [Planctomycetota bacterium]